MELSELVRKAQNAMDRGDYHLAAGACAHALAAYPNCLSAQRILGESLLEQGQARSAVEHFERALTLDPLSVVSRLGLGVASEELKDAGLAYAHYLHAWEINPALDQVRGQLVRLRATLGSHDRLHPTRAGLAGIHARGGQFGRAAAEWRALLAVDPESARAQTSLAEVLWRAGDDIGAATLCKSLLEQAPDNARALAMLAEIEKRQGSGNVAELVRRYQAIDPIGEVALLMSEYRPNTDLDFLTANALDIADYEFTAVAADMPTPTPSAPASSPALAASHVAAPDLWDNLVRDLQHETDDTSDPDASGLQPFSWSDDGAGLDLGPSVEPFSLDNLTEPAPSLTAPPASIDTSFDALVAESAPIPMAANDDRLVALETAQPSVAPAPMEVPVPVAAAVVEPPVAAQESAPAADPFVTADGRVDLTIGWDEIDRVLQEATPSGGDTSEYDDLLAELDADGAAPFAADDGADNSAWEPFSADEFADTAPPAAHVEVPALADEIVDIVPAANTWPVDASAEMDPSSPEIWGDFEDDLISAIPSPQPSGYTELLRHVDNEELAGLADLYEDEVDPLINPDSSGEPLEFEALLSVTSRDGTAELQSVEPMAAPVTPLAAEAGSMVDDLEFDLPAFVWADDPADAVPDQAVELAPDGELEVSLGEIEPFSFDDLLAASGENELNGSVAADGQYGDLEAAFAPIPHVVDIPDDLPAVVLTHTPEPVVPFDIADVSDASEAFDWSSVVADEPVPVLAAVHDQAEDPLSRSDDFPRWPTFVGHTSDLIDRDPVDLFDRLRSRKQALQASGAVVVDRVIAVQPQHVRSAPGAPGAPDVAILEDLDGIVRPVTRPRLATVDGFPVDREPIEERGLDLTRMRIRLIESESAAAEIASTLEEAIARGDTEPLTLRVLGEAYLRLGRTEQAAAQFRESMLARRRVR